MPKNPTKKQTAYLLSKGSPLTEAQKAKFLRELRGKKAKIRKK
jgi:hypothetical protein